MDSISRISSQWSKVASTAVAWLGEERVLVGQGQFVMVVQGGTVLDRCQVLRRAVVHSLEKVVMKDRWVVRGGKSLAVVNVIQEERVEVVIEEIEVSDWIIASAIDEERLLVLTAHNKLLTLSLDNLTLTQCKEVEESDSCILYSGLLLPEKKLVMSGTVWGRLLIWRLDTGQLMQSVGGHDGVIFSVSYWSGMLITSSDDRSSILYKCDQTFTDVQQVARLWGHTARVFRMGVCQEKRILITAGEDGKLIIWSLDSGERLNTMVTCSPVWSLAVRGSSVLAGGGDGSVTRLSLATSQRSASRLEVGLTTPKLVHSLTDRILVMGEGQLVSYDIKTKVSHSLYCNKKLSSYCLMEVRYDRLVLAGLEGLLVLADLSQPYLSNLQTRQVIPGKIFSCGVFSVGEERKIMTCDGEGRLTLLDCSGLQEQATGQLPVMRERWFTTSCSWAGYYVLGDRCGGLHLLHLSAESLTSVQSWPRLHGRHGVTQLLVDNGILWTSGRDGTVRSFKDYGSSGVEMIQSVRPGHDWVAGLVRLGTILSSLVWRGSELQLRSLSGDSLLGSTQCGGGHRSWSLVSGPDNLSVVYVKDGTVMMSPLSREEITVLLPGQHTQQINVVRAVGGLVITGSEDTTVRVFRDGHQMGVLRGHLSSIKCMDTVREPRGSLLLMTGGGRGELRLWRLATLSNEVFCLSIASHMEREVGKGKRKAWLEAQSEKMCEGETRLMCLAAEQAGDHHVTIYAACSDGALRQYIFSLTTESLELVQTGEARPHCLEQVILVGNRVVTSSTGGDISVNTKTDLIQTAEAKVHQSGVNCLEVKRETEDYWVLVTGGDDTSLVVTIYQDSKLDVVWRSDRRAGHTTQITALRLVGDLVLSAGVDQRLMVWKLSSDGKLVWQSSKVVSVADISDMDCWQQGEDLHCVLVGVGLEMLTFTKL